jgi:hypothetical protein
MTARPSPTPIIGVADIFKPLDPVKWLCKELDMAPGAPTLIAGYGYSGKSLALQDLALAVASGTKAWGSFDVRSGRVLHLDYEQGAYLTRMRYQRLARGRGIEPSDLSDRLSVAVMPPWYLDNDARGELARVSEGFDLVVLDSFKASCPSTDENTSEARIPLDRLGRISELTGTCFMTLHHSRKPSRDRDGLGGARMAIRGSGALYDACGSVLVFAAEKGEPIAVAHEKARISGRTHDDFRLSVEDVEIDGDPRAGLRVSRLSVGPGKVQDAPGATFAALRARIVELARTHGTLGSKNEIRIALGARKDDVGAAVDSLERSGALVRGGTYHHPTYSLTGTDRDAA